MAWFALSGLGRNAFTRDDGTPLNHNPPTISTIAKLAWALGMKASELVAEAEREGRRR